MIKRFLKVACLYPVWVNACDFPPEIPVEFYPPECIAPAVNVTLDSLITPEKLDRQWQAGNKSRLSTLQSARLNPYSDKYLEKVFSLDFNKSIDKFDIETIEDGDERAEITGSHLYWYGENFFFDSGNYRLDYTITNLDMPDGEEEKDVGYMRSLFGARFNPILDLSLTFGVSINKRPKVIDGQFDSGEDKSTDLFFAISGMGFHYSKEQSDEVSSDYTSYNYIHDQLNFSGYWLRLDSEDYDLDDEYGLSASYAWGNEDSVLSNTLKLSRMALINTNSEYWGAELEYDRFTIHVLSFDSENEVREAKYGYGVNINITDFLASKSIKGRLRRDSGVEVGVHLNNIGEYVLTAEDQIVWSLIFHFKYG